MLIGTGLYLLAAVTTLLGFAVLHWLRPFGRPQAASSSDADSDAGPDAD
jgi:hypothetical protein